MSEYLNNSELRVKELLEFSMGLIKGGNGAELIKKHEEAIDNVTPHDMLKIMDMLVQADVSAKNIKSVADKIINVFHKKLESYRWEGPKEDSFLYYLMEENRALEKKLKGIKKILIRKDISGSRKELLSSVTELTEMESHYVKKENILFPYLEKKMERYRALNIMWSLHDDVRKTLKNLMVMLKNKTVEESELKIEIGGLFFLMYGLIQKEELIVYPAIMEVVSEDEWEEMYAQSFEYEFSFIETPERRPTNNDESCVATEHAKDVDGEFVFKTETGEMNLEQLLLVLNKLPIDITFVDENNRVRFFSKPEERFFPRSPAIIGREVKNCHPPESVHVVEKIVEAFKSGEKDTAKFWLNLRGKFVIIQYFALRNDKGEYKGVLETSQDVTEIRSLEGQQKLLDWED